MDYVYHSGKPAAVKKSDIVVVDDNRDNLRLLSDILQKRGHEPRPVSSGKMALDAICARPPDLVIVDIMMPETDGLEVCRQLKAAESTRDIPVIFISALYELEEKLKAFEAGGVDYITKPFQQAEVIARVETHLALSHAREALRRSSAREARLEKAESLVRLAGAIAHNFNNYLQAVTGNLELARMHLGDEEKVAKNIAAAVESARKAAEVSRQMLTYTGRLPGSMAVMDLADFCRRRLSALTADLPESIDVDTDLPQPGPAVMASSDMIREVAFHLVSNAREALAAGGGTIRVAVKEASLEDLDSPNRFPVDWQPRGEAYAFLAVSDDGPGIAEADIERIFDPFFSTHFTGRGMGLPAVMGIATAHGGGVTVESAGGGGSVFKVFFPISEAASREAAAASRDAAAGHAPHAAAVAEGVTVLVVEDEMRVRNMIAAYLENKGYRVIEAVDGVDAVAKFARHKNDIQCVLTDLSMPGMNGYETLEALRQIAPAVYVILSSGHDEAQVAAGAGHEKPDALLAKPYDLEALAEAIQKGIGSPLL